ncbi:hypothetical protein Tco_0382967 [Tanacetum coccineum]
MWFCFWDKICAYDCYVNIMCCMIVWSEWVRLPSICVIIGADGYAYLGSGQRGETNLKALKNTLRRTKGLPLSAGFDYKDKKSLRPIGDNASYLSSLIGEIVKTLALDCNLWENVPPTTKVSIMPTIQGYFDLKPHFNDKTLVTVGKNTSTVGSFFKGFSRGGKEAATAGEGLAEKPRGIGLDGRLLVDNGYYEDLIESWRRNYSKKGIFKDVEFEIFYMMRRSDEEKETLKKEAHEAKKQCLEASQRLAGLEAFIGHSPLHLLLFPSLLLLLLRSRPFFFCCSVPVPSSSAAPFPSPLYNPTPLDITSPYPDPNLYFNQMNPGTRRKPNNDALYGEDQDPNGNNESSSASDDEYGSIVCYLC